MCCATQASGLVRPYAALGSEPKLDMNRDLTVFRPTWQSRLTSFTNATMPSSAWLKISLISLAAAAAIATQAQIQTAGTVFINVDATTNAAGALSGNDIIN